MILIAMIRWEYSGNPLAPGHVGGHVRPIFEFVRNPEKVIGSVCPTLVFAFFAYFSPGFTPKSYNRVITTYKSYENNFFKWL